MIDRRPAFSTAMKIVVGVFLSPIVALFSTYGFGGRWKWFYMGSDMGGIGALCLLVVFWVCVIAWVRLGRKNQSP